MQSGIAVLLITGAAAFILNAQAPVFEVASIRLNEEENMPSIAPGLRNGRFTAHRTSLRQLLASAYDLTQPQVIGPEWLDNLRFDIVAKAAAAVPDSAMALMLRALLEERFKLAAHLETRTVPAYHLTVAPGGVKMPLYPAPYPVADEHAARGLPMLRGATTTARIAEILSFFIGKPVIDKTGLTGRYSYFLSFAPLSPQPGADPPEFRPPDIFTAVQKQLGLKLDLLKDAVPVLIVDYIQKSPSEN